MATASKNKTDLKIASPEVQISKYLSFVLRHNPEAAGIRLDAEGWIDVETLIKQANKTSGAIRKLGFNKEVLERIVLINDKKRFTLSEDKTRIRAAQGHSTQEVDIKFEEQTPPAVLYHGTSVKAEPLIIEGGIKPMTRQYVHLSADVKTALEVGRRHGKPVVLAVRASFMQQDGEKFFKSENEVWLVKEVGPQYIYKLLADPEALVARQRESARTNEKGTRRSLEQQRP